VQLLGRREGRVVDLRQVAGDAVVEVRRRQCFGREVAASRDYFVKPFRPKFTNLQSY
jgi:hypothetical protein